jgi:hypothetical protein
MIAALAKAADTAAISLFRRFIPMVIPTFQYGRPGCPITLPMEDCEDAEMACDTFQERCNAPRRIAAAESFDEDAQKSSECLQLRAASLKIASVAHRRVTGSILFHILGD